MTTVIQDSNDAITFQDLEGNILAWNRGAEIMYGYTEAEALSMNIVDTVPQEYQEEARQSLSSLKRGELVPNLETKRKHKDGRIIDVSLINTKLTDDKGKLTGIATTERDITILTITLEKFRRMATVIQDSNDAITFQDLEGNILAWNRGAELMYGYSEAEALSKNIVDTVPTEYQEEARQFLASLKRGELVPNLETKRRTKDGRIIDVWLTNTKLTDDKGLLTGIATTERDISERIGALEKFRRMATVIQDSNDAITFQDLEGNILAWNQGAEIIYGYSQAEALSMNIVDTVPKEYQEEARGFLGSLKRGELLPNLETKRKHKDGRIIDVWLTNTKLTNDKGVLTGIATTERDITERKHAEASLRDKARELEFLREGQITLSDKMRGEQDLARLGQSVLSHLAPFLNAHMGAFYYVTEEKNLKRVSGYAYATLEERARTIAFGEGLVGQAALEKNAILIDKVPGDYFGKISSDLGHSAPCSLILAPVFYEGEVNGVIELASFASFSDHQKTFLEHVSENIGIAINTSVSRRKQQLLLERSQNLTEELQAQQGELKATNDELEEQSRALQESQRKLKSQQSELELTNEQLEKQTQALERQRDVLNANNEALNQAQTLLEERSDEVQRASQYKTEFLANMSHELRTPLNSSLILAKLLADNATGNLTGEQIQFAQSISSAGNDLLNLINDILDLSKVEAGKLEIRPESVFLPRVFNNLKKTFDPLAKDKNLRFVIKIDPDLPERMITDHQRLEQILKNLLSNAFKFTEEGQITLHVESKSPGRISLSVIDTGIGVPKDQQVVIFEAFRQADGTTNRKYGGTGLGLSISRDLARLLGGSVEVESLDGRGSRFTLILPEVYDELNIVAASPKVYSSSALNTLDLLPVPTRTDIFADDRDNPALGWKTLLVIEDESLFARILFDMAHEHGYRCIVAHDAAEGMELVKRFSPDAILLDIMLPDQSGLTVLDQLKDEPLTRHIPVQIVSGHDYIEKALHMGALGYVLKPAKKDELNAAFARFNAKIAQKIKRVLIVEDDKLQRESMVKLLSDDTVEITAVALAGEALKALETAIFDCMVIDLKLPDMSGEELLRLMTQQERATALPPVIVYTGRSLSREDEERLGKYSRSIIIKGVHSPERLLDEISLFLHIADSSLSSESRKLLKTMRSRDDDFEGRRILVVDDDVRNIFALTAALEQRGATVEVARNGKEALSKLKDEPLIDIVLMDIMMPEMDGFQATREIRKQSKFAKIPIIAVTAKATKKDQILCMEAGASDYLAKPIDLNQLFSLIRIWAPQLGRG
ncbi:MAG: PAS domain S-box protein [Chitinophagaceae bacterium]|nr:PAS domain S-box protein [Oligoflexus sp.]